jgi:hypothetical protein
VITSGGRHTRHTHPIAALPGDVEVYADLTKPPLSTNISRNPHLLNLIEEAIENLTPAGPTMQLEYDMKRTVGYTEVVETNDTDTVFYARQLKAGGYTRFVKNGKSSQTQHITIILARDETGDYQVKNVWIGKFFPAVPGEPGETAASKDFWANHAVIHNGQPLIASTITKTCPY